MDDYRNIDDNTGVALDCAQVKVVYWERHRNPLARRSSQAMAATHSCRTQVLKELGRASQHMTRHLSEYHSWHHDNATWCGDMGDSSTEDARPCFLEVDRVRRKDAIVVGAARHG